jgi:class 3 adenylate cyclase
VEGLPAGTVTFVFTDVEGSTGLLKSLGDAYGQVLSQHRRLVRDSFGAAGGIEIDTQGDAFFFAFPRARDAVAAAVAAQRGHADADWPDGVDVRVRIGLHTGEPAVAEEGYLGLDVVRAARICTVAQGGNVLLSETTRALIGSSLPDGVSVFPLGERHLKGIDEPERVFELEIEGVPAARHEPAAEPAPDPARVPEPAAKEKPKSKSKLEPGAPRETPVRREDEFERRIESFGARLADAIQERVFNTIEKSLGKVLPPSDDADLDDLADRADRFEQMIRARVEASLRASDTPPAGD